MAQLWGGRFTKQTNQLVHNFNESISFDQKFYRQDIAGSIAHVTMLAKQGIITAFSLYITAHKRGKIIAISPINTTKRQNMFNNISFYKYIKTKRIFLCLLL